MTATMIPGTQGYAEQAARLIEQYEAIAFEQKYRDEIALLPTTPSRVLDVGAGTGADAAWLAARGHRVLAVEPTRELRQAGERLHPSPAIEWLDDHLPELAAVRARPLRFDLIMLTAVWMHLDAGVRPRAMFSIASLLARGGLVLMAIRHGPVPPGRTMHEIPADETVALAEACGLRNVLNVHAESSQPANRAAGIRWTRLGFRSQ